MWGLVLQFTIAKMGLEFLAHILENPALNFGPGLPT
jgi:hypothetical protein